MLLAIASVTQSRAEPLQIGSFGGVPIAVEAETLFHTLVADFFIQSDDTVYVQTGDIPAMWLRDSSAQTLPYIRLGRARPALRTWVRGVIERDARNILVDPYANAFTANYRVWERKWEADSLAYPVVLAWSYFARSRDRRVLTTSLHKALQRVVSTYACERHHTRCSRYGFSSLSNGGRGEDVPERGMIWSAFRASDDPTIYPYNVPEQMLAVVALQDLASLAEQGFHDRPLANEALGMSDAVRRAVARYGRTYDFRYGWMYAYEVDGLGHQVLMDDANLPSLLGAPLFGYLCADDPAYRSTRSFVLSRHDPYFYRGRYAHGIGSEHTPRGWVWPLALITRALTAEGASEVLEQLAMLSTTGGERGLIHESFDPDDPHRYTREEFGWANAFYAELLFRAAAGFAPEIVAPVEDRPLAACMQPSAILDPIASLNNRGRILSAFERVVPLPVVAPDSDSL